MITPNQIKEKVLSTSSHGYDIDETNAFIDEIAESYAAIYAENKELYRKLEVLASKVEEYREDEDSIKTAIITAQKAANQISKAAKDKAEELLADSANTAQKTVLDAKEKAEKLVSEARDYVTNLTKEKSDAANAITSEAEKRAESIVSGAKETIEQVKQASGELVTKAREEKAYHENLVTKLKEESSAFKKSLVSLYESQLSKLRDMMGAQIDEEMLAADENLENLQNDLNNIYNDIISEDYKSEEENQSVPEETDAQTAEPEIDEKSASEEDIEPIEEPEENTQSEEITDNTEEESVAGVDINSAIDAFTNDEITPINEHPINEITEEPEMEEPAEKGYNEELPFESFFNVKHNEGRTNEKISLIPPEDYDEEEEDLKFRGFFKKKKDKKGN